MTWGTKNYWDMALGDGLDMQKCKEEEWSYRYNLLHFYLMIYEIWKNRNYMRFQHGGGEINQTCKDIHCKSISKT